MKVEVKPSEKPEKLAEHLKPRVKEVKMQEDGWIKVETSEKEKIARTPGVEKYRSNGKEFEGLGGKPIHREAFMKIKNWEDAAKAFLATVKGVKLYIETERQWDVRALKKYNSGIVQADRKVADELDIEELEEVDMETEKLLAIYKEFLTDY